MPRQVAIASLKITNAIRNINNCLNCLNSPAVDFICLTALTIDFETPIFLVFL